MPTPLLSRKAVSPTGDLLVGDLFELLGVHAFSFAPRQQVIQAVIG
jgi:hypothetical protein